MASFLVWDTLGSPVGIQLPAVPAAPLPCRRLLPPSCCVSPEMGTRATAGRTLQEGSGAFWWASRSPPLEVPGERELPLDRTDTGLAQHPASSACSISP